MSKLLIAVAAPREVAAILRGLGNSSGGEIPLWTAVEVVHGVDLVRTGVGPAAAAGGVSRALDPALHGAVLSLGVAGSVPGVDSLEIGAQVLASSSMFIDLGTFTPEGFLSIEQMGFGTTENGGVFTPDPRLAAEIEPRIGTTGPIATVSSCSGTDARAEEVRAQLGSGPAAEAMEGAAVGLVAAIVGVGFAEIRVISNTCGDRDRQRWDLDGALEVLSEVACAVAEPVHRCL